ncbi:hypothetical protein E1I69_11375 [Bacillus timonensis]|uniref:Fibronectin type-III domain-containing protein n=1 Tax=Bacillus timonensis TaxID=1033734 RepID=A0A4S3PSM1_9BACI|nr:metallophosphoesterase [Bacillus timonensis]THE12296.1 hypothetical protein E1I69_11375 [Bacillus timonensis]
MKRIACLTILLLSFLMVSTTVLANTDTDEQITADEEVIEENDTIISEDTPLLQFPVISDIHICSKQQPVWNGTYCDGSQSVKFINALNDFKNLAPDYQAIVTNGDITNQGLEVQYQEFMSILNNPGYIAPSVEKVITMGNHEFYEPRYWPKPGLTDELLVRRYIQNTGVPNVYYDRWIKDYHFIVLGNEKSSQNNYALLSETQYKWLEETLPIQADPSKPIFVFLHQPIDGTVYGSDKWGGGLRDGRLTNILKKYPQVILFTGHSHYFLNHPRTVYQDGFTMVNTGAVEYLYYDGGAVRGQSQGILVNVYNDKVEIKARDFTKKAWIGEYDFKVPFEKTVFDNEPPVFDTNAKVTVSGITQTKAIIEWDKATDNSLVERYDIKLNGKIIKSEYLEFWKGPSKSRFSLTLDDLEDNTEYQVEISAVDGWKNRTVKPLTLTFKTDKFSGWVVRSGEWYYYDPTSGDEKEGWFKYNNQWYFLDQDGKMETGWITFNGKRYFLDSTGIMQTGWVKTEGKWYYLNQDGSIKTGWFLSGDYWYYLDQNGKMETGWTTVNGKRYFLDSSGVMKTGWIQTAGKWYYLNQDGSMKMGWFLDKGKWYFLNKNGDMSIGWLNTGGQWYFLNASGAMQTGWLYTGGKWYFLSDSGSMRTGWLKDKNIWYYLQPSGAMQTGWLQLSEGWYYLSDSGSMKTGWIQLGGTRYYLNQSGLWVK